MTGDRQVITLDQSRLSTCLKGEENITIIVEKYHCQNGQFWDVGEKKKELKNSKYSKRKKRKIEVNEINRTSYSDTTAGSSTGLTADGRIPRAAPPALLVLAAGPQLNLLQLAAESIQIPEKEDGLIYSVCSAYITSFKTESPATACPSQVFIFL